MIYPRLGQVQGHKLTNIVSRTSPSGDPLVVLDREGDRDPALVIRSGADSEWRPMKSVEELRNHLAQNSGPDRGLDIGVWTDRRRWLVLPADGKPQEKEVRALEDEWREERFHHLEDDANRQGQIPENTGYFYVNVRPQSVKVLEQDGQTILDEPEVTSRVRVEQLLGLVEDGANVVPTGIRTFEHQNESEAVRQAQGRSWSLRGGWQ